MLILNGEVEDKFTYHIVNIKQCEDRGYTFEIKEFTYHIVNIKLIYPPLPYMGWIFIYISHS